MGRWAQAQRMGSASAIGQFFGYLVTSWHDYAGIWSFEWLCSSDPVRWEYRQWYYSAGAWIGPNYVTLGGSVRAFGTGIASTIPMRAQIRSYTARGFGEWTPVLQTF